MGGLGAKLRWQTMMERVNRAILSKETILSFSCGFIFENKDKQPMPENLKHTICLAVALQAFHKAERK